MNRFRPLLAAPAYPADGYARLADRIAALMGAKGDVVFVQAEAIVALEAAATSLARPGLTALNIVTSPYGLLFGEWLRCGGASVAQVRAEPGMPASAAAVARALEATPAVGLVAVVHAETSSGILNPLEEIAMLAKARGALLVVDAVASFAGHALDVHGLEIDICVIGPQKAMQGPAGLSAVSISPRAWQAMDAGKGPSALNLLDLKKNWIDAGRLGLPGMPSALEFWALEAALDELEAEGLRSRIARHAMAARASRAGLVASRATPWADNPEHASTLVTAARAPEGLSAEILSERAARYGGALSPGHGAGGDRVVRLAHTGVNAALPSVLANVVAYASALCDLGRAADPGAGARAVAEVYRASVSAHDRAVRSPARADSA